MIIIKKVIEKISIILIIILCIVYVNICIKENKLDYKAIIKNEHKIHNGNTSKSAENISHRLENEKLSSYDRASNLVAWATFMYLDKDFDKFESEFKDIEKTLIKNRMYEELVHLYSMITSIYTGRYEYEKAYIYMYNAEMITLALYEEEKDNEHLSILLAIRYLKVNIAINLGLETEADKAFKDSEKLRIKNNIKDRVDICRNIATYYEKKGDYEQAKIYAQRTIKASKNKKEYNTAIYLSKVIIANAYLENNEPIEKTINLLKDINENYKPSEILSVDKYLLYAKFYKMYNMDEKNIEYLLKSYDILKNKKDILRSKFILEQLINIYEKSDDKDSLNKVYKEYIDLGKRHDGYVDIEFIIASITNTNIIEVASFIRKLKLKNQKLIYFERILILIIICIIFLLKKYININRYDRLTQIYNRGYFDNIYKKYNKNNEKYFLIIFDIDDFKKLNDTYGHSFGDTVLIQISKNIKNMLGKKSKVFRYGGEEFVILVKDDNEKYALSVAESVRTSVANMVWREPITVTTSIGMSYSGNGNKDMLETADLNLYKSKKKGKNMITY